MTGIFYVEGETTLYKVTGVFLCSLPDRKARLPWFRIWEPGTKEHGIFKSPWFSFNEIELGNYQANFNFFWKKKANFDVFLKG